MKSIIYPILGILLFSILYFAVFGAPQLPQEAQKKEQIKSKPIQKEQAVQNINDELERLKLETKPQIEQQHTTIKPLIEKTVNGKKEGDNKIEDVKTLNKIEKVKDNYDVKDTKDINTKDTQKINDIEVKDFDVHFEEPKFHEPKFDKIE